MFPHLDLYNFFRLASFYRVASLVPRTLGRKIEPGIKRMLLVRYRGFHSLVTVRSIINDVITEDDDVDLSLGGIIPWQ